MTRHIKCHCSRRCFFKSNFLQLKMNTKIQVQYIHTKHFTQNSCHSTLQYLWYSIPHQTTRHGATCIPYQAKALAEEGLFDLVSDAWGDETSDRAHTYVEEDALPYLPIDARAFELAVEGKLEPGGELETTYGKPAVEVSVSCDVHEVVRKCIHYVLYASVYLFGELLESLNAHVAVIPSVPPFSRSGAQKLIRGDTCKGSTRYWNYLEDHWPCAG